MTIKWSLFINSNKCINHLLKSEIKEILSPYTVIDINNPYHNPKIHPGS